MNHQINVCVMYPNESSYSETFIQDQIYRLPEKVFPLYGAWFPYLQPGGKHILNRNIFLRAYRRFCRDYLKLSQQQQMNQALVRYLRKNKIDVVLAHYGPTGVAVMERCVDAAVPLVVHFHGFDAWHYQTLNEYQDGYKRLFQLAKKVIVVSGDMKDHLVSLGCPPEKIELNSCGVDTDYFCGGAPEKVGPEFIAVARFDPSKGPDLTVTAFSEVLREVPEAKLNMIGEGELFDKCKQLSNSLGIERSVRFLGSLPHEDVRNMLRKSKIFVQHSIRVESGAAEGNPVSVLEASSTGLPVVATRLSGLKESVVHGETGYLTEQRDVTGMAQYMIKLALDDYLCREMGQKGRQRMLELFDMEKRIARLDEILREARR